MEIPQHAWHTDSQCPEFRMDNLFWGVCVCVFIFVTFEASCSLNVSSRSPCGENTGTLFNEEIIYKKATENTLVL